MKKFLLPIFFIFFTCLIPGQVKTGGEALGTKSYNDFEKPTYCGSACHKDFFEQWQQTMMSQAYTHHWDEIEYFKLAIPHAEKDPFVAEVKAGCNGCHSPLAFLAGDIPPQKPEMKSRANESVSCAVCHSITGFSGDTPYNFNFISEPGKTKYSGRMPELLSPAHEIKKLDIFKKSEFCGVCHNEKNPYGIWVKSTHLEWKEGPYAKDGVQCQTCHMPPAETKTSNLGKKYADARQHLFHGAHDPGKVKGTIEIRIHPDIREAEPGETVNLTAILFNQKTGHKFPTGSVEDRILWLHVEATDSKGKVYHLPVNKKGFEGEEYTISGDVLAYKDMGIALDNKDFQGVQRDGIPVGDRIFRMPYLDPQGIMTIQQWNTKSLGVDYRFAPRDTKVETYTFRLPNNIPSGTVTVKALLNYQKLVKPVADFLGVPEEESEIIPVNEHTTTFTILD
ncbi:MAG: hypothetical protein C4539_00980 [Ignavibacteriales bacterium]|nr:MAG: hypothetical protein C4539_00980 [Ignavibacteriales bacterium]